MPLPRPGPVFEAFWRFAAERHNIYLRRRRCEPSPWTDDRVLARYRFTNAFRVLDRVSQTLVRDVIDAGPDDADDVVLRVLLYKIFNRESTWAAIVEQLGIPSAATFDPTATIAVLDELMRRGERVYSGAYIMPPVEAHRGQRKHVGHVHLLASVLDSDLPKQIACADSLQQVFRALMALPGVGRFLAFQYTIDLNYSELLPFGEDDFVVTGPGALDGISKCFPDTGRLSPEDIILEVTRQQREWFERLGLPVVELEGRALQPVDVQNLFCEVSKYTRATFPNVPGVSGRTRIKQRFTPAGPLKRIALPAKWASVRMLEPRSARGLA
jgi:hypothetical protein